MADGLTDGPAALRNRDLPLAARRRLAFLASALDAWREANAGSDPPPDVLARILAPYPGHPPNVATRVRRPAER
jgi:hypothetical protein